jgi:hypothetical protein
VILVLALVGCGHARASDAVAPATDVIVMVGESTTYGQTNRSSQSPVNAAATLEWLLSRIDYPCPYARLPVRNWAVSASTTDNWFEDDPGAGVYCTLPDAAESFPLVKYACDHGGMPFARAVKDLAQERGENIIALLVNAQGTNDAHHPELFNPLLTAERVAMWRSLLQPAPTWISPPFNRQDDPAGGVVRLTMQSPEALERYVQEVRQAEINLGILSGPDWGTVLPKPTFQADGFHFLDGFSAAAGTFWLDRLCPSPEPGT